MKKLPTIESYVILYHGILYYCERLMQLETFNGPTLVLGDDTHLYHNLKPLPANKVPLYCRNKIWDPLIPLPIIHAIGE